MNEPVDASIDNLTPCPSCGSKERHFEELELSVGSKAYTQIRGKVWNKGKSRKPLLEFKSGDELHRKTGRGSDLKRTIDRENDNYKEVITDKNSVDIIHHCKEPLSQHKGHGSAKKRKTYTTSKEAKVNKE